MTKKRIMVVDDDIQSTRMVKLALERTGRYDVQQVNDPVRALDAARTYKPDLILLDICMPGTEGVDVAFQIRADPEFQTIPVVFLSSIISEREALGDGTTTGGFHFVAKPARLPRMITCIEKSLETNPRSDQLPTQMELS
jgi:two-component system, OmpR family, response regulator